MGYLSESARRRIAALLLIAGLVIAVLAAADVGPLFDDPPTEAERVQAAVEKFFDAGSAKDFEGACAQLTVEARRAMEQRAGAAASQKGLKGCDQILGLFLAKIKLAKVNDVRVSGNKAVVDGDLKAAGSPSKPTTVDLFEVNGEWRISDFGT